MWHLLFLLFLCSLSQLYPHIINYGKLDSTTNTLKFCMSRARNEGKECFLSYGNLSSSHLITFYGFIPKGDNPYDVIPLGEFWLRYSVILFLSFVFDDEYSFPLVGLLLHFPMQSLTRARMIFTWQGVLGSRQTMKFSIMACPPRCWTS